MEEAELAAAQAGVIARRQVGVMGITPRMIDIRLASGRWVRRHNGVYVIAGTPATWKQELWAAWLALGPTAAVSHRAAGRLWPLDGCDPPPIELTLPGLGRRELGGVIVHRSTALRRVDVVIRDGLPVTRPAPTLLALSSVLSRDNLEDAHDSAVRNGLVTAAYRQRWLDRFGSKGMHGAANLRAIVDDRERWGLPGSRMQLQGERLLLAAGIGRPTRQFVLRDARGVFLAKFDHAWPQARVAVEWQSYRHHSGRKAWRRDVGRANGATAEDWLVLLGTQDDIDAGPWGAPIVSAVQRALLVRAANHRNGGQRP